MQQIKRMVLNDRKTKEPYFMVNKTRWLFSDLSSDGFNLTMFTNCGYYGRYKFISIEHGINDFAILEALK